MREVTVKLRWEDDFLFAGVIRVGRVSRLPITNMPPWATFVDGFSSPQEFFPTEAEARAAVEAAVIKALGGNDAR